MAQILMDSGPLVAYVLRDEQHNTWVQNQMASVKGPALTCEAVLVEAAYLVAERGGSPELLWNFLRRGVLQIAFDLETEFEAVAALMRRYQNLPMDLADACLVRMSGLHLDCTVWTLDSDFRIYRCFSRQVIPVNCPD